MARTRKKLDWTSLPGDLLFSIAKLLPSRIDVLRFRAVCYNFRRSVPLPPKRLLPKIPLPSEFSGGASGQLLLTHSTVYAVEPLVRTPKTAQTSGMWLIRIEESNSGNVVAKNVLTEGKLPRNKLPESLSFLDYRIKEISKDYSLQFVPDLGSSRAELDYGYVVVSDSYGEIDEDFSLMAVLEPVHLMLWRYGDEDWTYISYARSRNFNQFVYWNGRFFALDFQGVAIIVDPKSLSITKIKTPCSDLFGYRHKFLSNSDVDLFLIVKTLAQSYYNCFKLNEEKLEWLRVTDELDDSVPWNGDSVSLTDGLNDRVFILGVDYMFSVSAQEFSILRRNCVYYFDNFYEGNGSNFEENMAIFDLKEKTAWPLHAFPGHPYIFWPPPIWLRSDYRLARRMM